MSRLIRKSHNVSILVYHFVCTAKYRRVVIDEKVDQVLKEVCLEIADRYQIEFLKIGTDKDHVHFLVQSVPSYSPTKIITMIKRLTAREVFTRDPSVKKQLWGGEFWLVNIVSVFVNSRVIFTTHSRVVFTSHDRVHVYHQNERYMLNH